MRGAVTLLTCAAMLLLSPITVPGALVLHAIEDRQMRSAARRARCSRCGTLLGVASLKLADEEWRAHVEQLQRDHPDVQFRLVRSIYAICRECGQRYTYRKKERRFAEETP